VYLCIEINRCNPQLAAINNNKTNALRGFDALRLNETMGGFELWQNYLITE